MADEQHNPWTTHGTDVRYENPWIRVEHSDVTTPGGSDGIYGVVRFAHLAVGIVPVDDDDHTWLVGQYRYALDEYSWEIPAGGCPQGESVENTARRELTEETGLLCSTLTPLFSGVRLSNSVTNETAFCFVATDLSSGVAVPDDTEELALRRLPVDAAIDLVLNGTITDAFSVMALLWLQATRAQSRRA